MEQMTPYPVCLRPTPTLPPPFPRHPNSRLHALGTPTASLRSQAQQQALQALENPAPSRPAAAATAVTAVTAVSPPPAAKPPAVGDKDYWKELAASVSKHFASSPHSPSP